MQALRDLLRGSLSRSLSALSPLDRLGAAWPVAAGSAVSLRSEVLSFDGSAVTVSVADTVWLNHLRSVAPQLLGDLRRVSRLPLTDILFVLASQPAAGSSAPGGARRKPATSAPEST